MSDQYFLTEGARLRYRDEGTGPAIVFVHGWTLDLDMWDPQADHLKKHFRIVRFDRRGFGLSSGSPDLQQDATDLSALCSHLKAGPVGCVGMSQGARVVLLAARLAPQSVLRFVLDGPPALTVTSVELGYLALKALAQTEGLDAFRRKWARHPLARLETADPAQHQLLARMIERYPGQDLLSPSATPAQPAATAYAPELVTQTGLVLNGALDIASRLRSGKALASVLPRCEHAIVPLARHMVNLDNPTAYNSVLLRFFSQPADARSHP
jgi:pimeloyl-ACP methyl ester carboxylesterase